MLERMCDWCEVSKATSGLRHGERYCKTCDPYAWAVFLYPETLESNKRIALTKVERRLEVKIQDSEMDDLHLDHDDEVPCDEVVTRRWEEAIGERENTDRKDLLAARVAFGVMFLIVLVAIAGIYVVKGQC